VCTLWRVRREERNDRKRIRSPLSLYVSARVCLLYVCFAASVSLSASLSCQPHLRPRARSHSFTVRTRVTPLAAHELHWCVLAMSTRLHTRAHISSRTRARTHAQPSSECRSVAPWLTQLYPSHTHTLTRTPHHKPVTLARSNCTRIHL